MSFKVYFGAIYISTLLYVLIILIRDPGGGIQQILHDTVLIRHDASLTLNIYLCLSR